MKKVMTKSTSDLREKIPRVTAPIGDHSLGLMSVTRLRASAAMQRRVKGGWGKLVTRRPVQTVNQPVVSSVVGPIVHTVAMIVLCHAEVIRLLHC